MDIFIAIIYGYFVPNFYGKILSQILLYLNYLVRLAHNCSLSCPFKVMMLEILRELFWRKTFVQHEVPSGTSQLVGGVRLNLPVFK